MRKSIMFLAGVLLLSGCASSAFAQDKPKSKVRTITGCLSKAKGGDEYLLTGKNGSTWEVHSSDNSNSQVSLSDHVGHTVTATGVVSNAKLHNLKEDAKETAKDTGVTKDDKEHGHLTITAIKMVSESCKY
jgi:outer membrane murein-binding lipoprotein Lpp